MLSGALAEFEEFIAELTPDEFRRVEEATRRQLESAWLPELRNKPQVAAYYSDADLLLYGGAAGGGKTALIVGLACSQHKRSVIFRAQSVDLRGIEEELFKVFGTREGWNGQDKIMRHGNRVIELGHLEKPGAERSWQGRPHDLICFDEAGQLARDKVQFVLGWLRTDDFNQRCRCVMASNPPDGGTGDWLLEWFAPWIDEKFGNPAQPGELRYAATAPDREGTTVWLPDERQIIFTEGRNWRHGTQSEIDADVKELVKPLSRTFIPARLDDNPFLDKKYKANLQNLKEPWKSRLLYGDFTAGRQDHEWQVFPTAWVKEAFARWTENPPRGAVMSAIGVDVAQGGDDNTVLACRHAHWYGPLVIQRGIETPRPSDVAALVVKNRTNNGTVVVVDVGGGYGGGVKEWLEHNFIPVRAFNASSASGRMTADHQLYFVNLRAEAHWRFREALDPDQLGGSIIALPPDPQLLADLTAVRWKLTSRGIQIESKEDLKKPERLGRSPDRGDAVIMAWSEGDRAIVAALKKKNRAPFPALPKVESVNLPIERGTGWMGK
jgi:hypothetical protein